MVLLAVVAAMKIEIIETKSKSFLVVCDGKIVAETRSASEADQLAKRLNDREPTRAPAPASNNKAKLATRAMIVDRYGLRLSMDQVAEILAISPSSVYNMLSLGKFPIRTYKEGNRRFASYDAVADYLDVKAAEAK